jgi:hypothetical protein
VGLAAQERGPGLTVTLGRRLDPVLLQDLPHGGGCDLDTEDREFAVDPSVAPPTVLAGQSQDESLDAAAGRWTAGPLSTGGVGVAAHEVPVPPQNRVRGDDQVQLPELGPGEPVEERGQESAIRRGDTWPVDLPLQDGQLVPQRQYLDVLVNVAHRQQPYEGEHARHGEVGQSQQHGRSA